MLRNDRFALLGLAAAGLGCASDIDILVRQVPAVVSIAIVPNGGTLFLGPLPSNPIPLRADVIGYDAVSKGVYWRSSDTSILAIDASGNLRRKTLGQVVIRATAKADTTKAAEVIFTVVPCTSDACP